MQFKMIQGPLALSNSSSKKLSNDRAYSPGSKRKYDNGFPSEEKKHEIEFDAYANEPDDYELSI